jgi:hypothetical protein
MDGAIPEGARPARGGSAVGDRTLIASRYSHCPRPDPLAAMESVGSGRLAESPHFVEWASLFVIGPGANLVDNEKNPRARESVQSRAPQTASYIVRPTANATSNMDR